MRNLFCILLFATVGIPLSAQKITPDDLHYIEQKSDDLLKGSIIRSSDAPPHS